MFTKSKNRRKIGAITLLDAAILPVNPATLKASIEANGLILDGLDSQLDMHQFELTAADPVPVQRTVVGEITVIFL